MSFKYFPHTEADIEAMLSRIGVRSLDDLYADVPVGLRLKGDYALPPALDEMSLRRHFDGLASQNRQLTCFAGAGVYDHYTPAAVQAVVSRSEFRTAYTPYQAEVSQGTLHCMFEYQSMMAELTGMEISNASLYDGTTATAEAMMMAVAAARKANRVVVSATVDPKILAVMRTYAHFRGIEIVVAQADRGATDRADLAAKLAEGGVAAVVVQQPNRYGIVEDYASLADETHAAKALLVMNCVAADLAVLRTPGEWGADIAVGDGQSLGLPMSFGGPYVGYMCCTEKLMRKMPGRIVGATTDSRGQRVFTLTLQAREQHIRREKATSNICSNESLMALAVTVYMALMGRNGLKEAAELSYAGAHYMHDRLVATGHFVTAFPRPFFNEFCVRYDGDVDELQRRFADNGILGGVKVDADTIMFAVTEKRTKEEIDKLIDII